jgi:hypothetical protein
MWHSGAEANCGIVFVRGFVAVVLEEVMVKSGINLKPLMVDRLAVGVIEVDDVPERGAGAPVPAPSRYNDPTCEKRCAKRGIIIEATFPNKDLSSPLESVWYTLERGTPFA